MKKILSAFLMVVVTLQVATMDVSALGKDEVVWNPDGSKTIFVSTEKLKTYKQNLALEVEECLQRHRERHGEGSWKGFLLMLLPSLVIPLLVATVGFKGIKSYNRRTRIPIKNEDGTSEQVNDKLSILQVAMLGILYGATTFVGLLVANKFSPEHDAINCWALDIRNKSICRQLTLEPGEERIPGSSIDGILKYGARIECHEGDTGLCRAHSQLQCFYTDSDCYDPVIFTKELLPLEKRDEL